MQKPLVAEILFRCFHLVPVETRYKLSHVSGKARRTLLQHEWQGHSLVAALRDFWTGQWPLLEQLPLFGPLVDPALTEMRLIALSEIRNWHLMYCLFRHAAKKPTGRWRPPVSWLERCSEPLHELPLRTLALTSSGLPPALADRSRVQTVAETWRLVMAVAEQWWLRKGEQLFPFAPVALLCINPELRTWSLEHPTEFVLWSQGRPIATLPTCSAVLKALGDLTDVSLENFFSWDWIVAAKTVHASCSQNDAQQLHAVQARWAAQCVVAHTKRWCETHNLLPLVDHCTGVDPFEGKLSYLGINFLYQEPRPCPTPRLNSWVSLHEKAAWERERAEARNKGTDAANLKVAGRSFGVKVNLDLGW
eukprot:Protomagalhaensia_sp_Gyna_25__5007@NODE_552_length_3143_cov_759_267719_g430_i0_p2_GENE_NODE_552_length_3143_cov_759_267719_g430_i0NODE_552_length_3143_cov_759_267719_g430_i0_p2_ORF_typecomplete_len363_score20_57_NODE_552_length_3143_cov_759_267719_g430_i0711159